MRRKIMIAISLVWLILTLPWQVSKAYSSVCEAFAAGGRVGKYMYKR